MYHKSTTLLGLVGMLASISVHAEIFICKDSAGRTLTSDRPIMECADRAVRVLGKNGLTQRVIDAPLTIEQKQQQQEEENKRKAAVAVQEEQRRQDHALIARFRNEGDIDIARKRTLDQVNEHIRREETSIAESEKRLKDARAEAEFHKGKKTLPAVLQRRLDDAEGAIQESRKRIAELQAEVAQINAKYDVMLKRYRELNGASQASAKAESR